MALRRKQQKLAGFGARWQAADPTAAIAREGEVGRALAFAGKLHEAQRQVQGTDTPCECAAVYHAGRGLAVLTRRRGQVVESFGRRADGQWLLAPEEVLYLAERGTLAVHEAMPAPDEGEGTVKDCPQKVRDSCPGRRLALPEVFALAIKEVGLDSYAIYAHLRRAGHTVRPLASPENASGRGALRRRRGCLVDWVRGPPVTAKGPTEWLLVGGLEPGDRPKCSSCWSSSAGAAGATEVSVHAADARQSFQASLASHGVSSSEAPAGPRVFAVADAVGDLEFIELAAPTHPCDRRGGKSPTREAQAVGAEGSSDSEGPLSPACGAARRTAAIAQLDADSVERYAALRRRISGLAGERPPGALAPKPSRDEANQAEAWL